MRCSHLTSFMILRQYLLLSPHMHSSRARWKSSWLLCCFRSFAFQQMQRLQGRLSIAVIRAWFEFYIIYFYNYIERIIRIIITTINLLIENKLQWLNMPFNLSFTKKVSRFSWKFFEEKELFDVLWRGEDKRTEGAKDIWRERLNIFGAVL